MSDPQQHTTPPISATADGQEEEVGAGGDQDAGPATDPLEGKPSQAEGE
jgi:hypothetical protein